MSVLVKGHICHQDTCCHESSLPAPQSPVLLHPTGPQTIMFSVVKAVIRRRDSRSKQQESDKSLPVSDAVSTSTGAPDSRATSPSPPQADALPPSLLPGDSTTAIAAFTRPVDILTRYTSVFPPRPGPQRVLVNLASELAGTGTFTSPLLIDPGSASLSRVHFLCRAEHAKMRKSVNRKCGTACMACHEHGRVVLQECVNFFLRVCKSCARLLWRAGNLEKLLHEW